ncbi:MAG: YceI family protein [Bacteroidota bacterium]|jgi:polyisoprenoid-binding protein YceI
MRYFLLIGLCLLGWSANAQLFTTQTGEISFYSKTPMEDIDAVNKQVGSIINSANNEVAVQMRVTNFIFPNKLMQEHFNENYLETDKYPAATFKGKIKEPVDLKIAGTYTVTAAGTATIHGVSRPVELRGTIVSTGKVLNLTCTFDIRLDEYKIDIPKIVFSKIAEVIKVKGSIQYNIR